MKNLDLNAMGVEELSVSEEVMVNGGDQPIAYIDGILPIYTESLLKALLAHGYEVV